MKVLILVDAWFPFVGGAQVQIQNLKKILAKENRVEYYILHSFSSHILARFFWIFWVIPQAVFLNRKNRFDLIHAHAYWPGIPAKIIGRILNLPIVFSVHGSNLLDLGSKSLRAKLEKFILTKIKYDQVITAAANFLKYKNVNKKNITVIANGVDMDEFKTKAEKIKKRSLLVLSVGRNDPIKGFKNLKRAFKPVKKKCPNADLKIIYQDYSRKKLIKEYLKADLFILPSLSEGQPLVLLEAWAAKLPVVVTAVGDNPLMVKNGVNGYLAVPGNASDLTEKIIKVLQNKNRRQLGLNGYNLVKQNYTWKKCANKTYRVYQKALGKND